MEKQSAEVSVVVPVLNEQDNIGPLHQQITQTLTGKYDYEILVVDDGSNDKSFEILSALQKEDTRLRLIRFRRRQNYRRYRC